MGNFSFLHLSLERFYLFVWLWIGLAFVIFYILLFIRAPYGRHSKTTWGPMINNKFGWFIMEVFVLVVFYFFIFKGKGTQSLVNVIIISLFTFHYLNRSLIFPFRLKTKGKKMPAVIMLMGLTFNTANGFFLGYYLGNYKSYDTTWLMTPQFTIGIILFFTGLVINWQSDNILIGLRKGKETGYKIPYGRLFKYVSCPNLLGEIIEWMGFAILLWALPGWAFFIWTTANLVPRALANHKWYLAKFFDYPKERKAILPRLL